MTANGVTIGITIGPNAVVNEMLFAAVTLVFPIVLPDLRVDRVIVEPVEPSLVLTPTAIYDPETFIVLKDLVIFPVLLADACTAY